MKMKKILLLLIYSGLSITLFGQTSDGFIPSNRYISSLEKNILFNAPIRFQVTVTGSQSDYVNTIVNGLFDGKMTPYYTPGAIDPSNPLVIEISGLPASHTQAKSWVGWSTRYYQCTKFKIEGYNVYAGANTWVTIADVTGSSGYQYMSSVISGAYTKIRFTFYEGLQSPDAAAGRIGLSELFFLHPESVSAYDGLIVQYDNKMNVGIGTTTPAEKLEINGGVSIKGLNSTSSVYGFRNKLQLIDSENAAIVYNAGQSNEMMFGFHSNGNFYWGTGRSATSPNYYSMFLNANNGNLGIKGKLTASEVQVKVGGWADFVFKPNYNLRTLGELEQYIKVNNHLPDVPSATEVNENGINLGEMNARLLQKIEEMTLYMIEAHKSIELLNEKLAKQQELIDSILQENKELKKKL